MTPGELASHFASLYGVSTGWASSVCKSEAGLQCRRACGSGDVDRQLFSIVSVKAWLVLPATVKDLINEPLSMLMSGVETGQLGLRKALPVAPSTLEIASEDS